MMTEANSPISLAFINGEYRQLGLKRHSYMISKCNYMLRLVTVTIITQLWF